MLLDKLGQQPQLGPATRPVRLQYQQHQQNRDVRRPRSRATAPGSLCTASAASTLAPVGQHLGQPDIELMVTQTALPDLMRRAAAIRDAGHKHVTFSPKVLACVSGMCHQTSAPAGNMKGLFSRG